MIHLYVYIYNVFIGSCDRKKKICLFFKASNLWCSGFFMVQISHPYMTTGKTTLSIRTYVMKVMSLLFNMLSRLVITFLPRSKPLLMGALRAQKFTLQADSYKLSHKGSPQGPLGQHQME